MKEHEKTWRNQALCRDYDSELWYSRNKDVIKAAIRVCWECPVRQECLAAAFKAEGTQEHKRYGVWGGTTRENRNYLYKHRDKYPWVKVVLANA